MVRFGLDVLRAQSEQARPWGCCALMSNQASLTAQYEPSYRVLAGLLGDKLVALFGPQHGFWGTAQDNMIETGHTRLGDLDIPIYSLYSETREPTDAMLAGVDTILIDIQLVGCRIYTFKASILGCLRAAKKFGKRVVILDRPNPLGGVYVEGRCPDRDMLSFVAPEYLPMRHGLSSGEVGRFLNRTVGAELEVVAMEGWNCAADYRSCQRPWVLTSPNLPSLDPVWIYPGMVIFEGCNISEGRGTGLPFQFIGAPFLRKAHYQLISRVAELMPGLGGVHLREACFQPTSGKWQGQVCYGVQLHPQGDPTRIPSYSLALALLRAMWELSDGAAAWKEPPYEYEYSKLPMEVIIGSTKFREQFERFSLADPFWHEGVTEYLGEARDSLLYPRIMHHLHAF